MKNKKVIKEYFLITIASFITALAVNLFFIHNGLAPGGITGLSLVVSSVTNIDVEIMSLMITIPLLIIATQQLGSNFGIKTLYITLMTPLFLKVVPQIWILSSISEYNTYLELGLSGIAGGLLVGTGIALALKSDCATGGTDVMALLINKYIKKMEVSNIIFILDGIIILTSGFIKKNLWVSVFSLFSLIVIINTIKIITSPKEQEV